MPFSHYPKTIDNLVFAWVHPRPPDAPPANGRPRFLSRSFSTLNRFTMALEPDAVLVGFHDAQPFTRFYGSVAADQPLEISAAFSNDEVDVEGQQISDSNIHTLHYDALGTRQLYDPGKQEQTGKIFTMIFGRWIRVEARNVGKKAPTFLRLYLRGSVF